VDRGGSGGGLEGLDWAQKSRLGASGRDWRSSEAVALGEDLG
jgi:hypothetical protein